MPSPPETDVARIRKYCQSRVPASLRSQIRIEAAVRGSSVSIYKCRPSWQLNLTEWSKVRVAQLMWQRTQKEPGATVERRAAKEGWQG